MKAILILLTSCHFPQASSDKCVCYRKGKPIFDSATAIELIMYNCTNAQFKFLDFALTELCTPIQNQIPLLSKAFF